MAFFLLAEYSLSSYSVLGSVLAPEVTVVIQGSGENKLRILKVATKRGGFAVSPVRVSEDFTQKRWR